MEYQETVMRERLADLLRDWRLARFYEVNKEVGDDDFHVVMPFVHYNADIAIKAIKPLDLNKTEPSDIYHHGGAWVKNMERLKNRERLPATVVFTVRFPENGKQLQAAEDICVELRQLGVEPVDFNNPSRLRVAVDLGIAA